ncbi:hypothetical protein BG006_010124 [Podila minutissima]|uniref:F-box domain-containing protein n=1 Tax=Podila minutissima TaxID=64525 RepID=A0A9P5VIR8_9FUNG|nr:hypothetical protein BG006_010124 [Podila minutissima]
MINTNLKTTERDADNGDSALKVYNPNEKRNAQTKSKRTYPKAKKLLDHAEKEDEKERTRPKSRRKYPKRTIQEVDNDNGNYGQPSMGVSIDRIKEESMSEEPQKKRSRVVATNHVLQLVPINKSDPCSVFPHELWDMVLDSLPMSYIVNMALVSKTWLAGNRGYHGFKMAALNGRLGKKAPSHIPIVIQLNGDPLETWALCHDCRNRHYRLHPEDPRAPCNPLDPMTFIDNYTIPKTIAMRKYALKPADLNYLQSFTQTSGHVATVFYECEIQVQACQIHGGWVGLEAVKANMRAYQFQQVKKKEMRYHQYMSTTKKAEKNNGKAISEGKKDYKSVDQIALVEKFNDKCLEEEDSEQSAAPWEPMLPWNEDCSKKYDLFGGDEESIMAGPILFEYDDVSEEVDWYCKDVAAGLEDADWYDNGGEGPSSRGGSKW